VHTTSAAGTVTRIIDVFPVDQQEQIRIQLSSNLIAVLSQALCPLAVGKGRVAAYEFMIVTPAIANLIRENKTYRIDSSIQTGKKLGMQLLDEHLWQLYDIGKITLEEMLDNSRQPGALQDKATAKIAAMRGAKMKKKEAAKEMEDLGPILRT
jgi:twitching motility protein PilT